MITIAVAIMFDCGSCSSCTYFIGFEKGSPRLIKCTYIGIFVTVLIIVSALIAFLIGNRAETGLSAITNLIT